MKSFGLTFKTPWQVTESADDLSTEPGVASLLTTGNGYIGVRASLGI